MSRSALPSPSAAPPSGRRPPLEFFPPPSHPFSTRGYDDLPLFHFRPSPLRPARVARVAARHRFPRLNPPSLEGEREREGEMRASGRPVFRREDPEIGCRRARTSPIRPNKYRVNVNKCDASSRGSKRERERKSVGRKKPIRPTNDGRLMYGRTGALLLHLHPSHAYIYIYIESTRL